MPRETRTARHVRSSIVLIGVVVTLSAACSGADDPASTTSTGPATETASTGPTASVAAPTPPSGVASATGSSGATSATGPSGASSGPQDPPDVEPDPENVACSLLTEDLVEPIFGLDLGVANDVVVNEHSTCVLRDGANEISVELRITIGRRAADSYEALLASVDGADGVRGLDDLGDRAFRAFAANDAHVLALVGDTMVRLSIASVDGALTDETLTLARELVALI